MEVIEVLEARQVQPDIAPPPVTLYSLLHTMLPVILFVTLFLLMLPHASIYPLLGSSDEFTLSYDAKRIIEGQVLYRDFFNFPTPGTFYLLALVFHFFGVGITGARITTIVLVALSGTFMYLAMLRLTRNHLIACLPGLLQAGLLFYVWPSTDHHWFATCFSALALYVGVRYLYSDRPAWIIVLGSACATTFLFLQTDGVAVTGAALAYLPARWIFLERRTSSLHYRLTKLAKEFLLFLLGFTLAITPVLTYFASQKALNIALYDIFIWPNFHYAPSGGFNDILYAQNIRDPLSVFQNNHDQFGLWWYCSFILYLGMVSSPWLALAIGATLLLGRYMNLVRKLRSQQNTSYRGPDALLLTWLFALGTFCFILRTRPSVAHISSSAGLVCFLLVYLAYRAFHFFAQFHRPEFITFKFFPLMGVSLFLASGIALDERNALLDGRWQNIARGDTILQHQDGAVLFLQEHLHRNETVVALPFGGPVYLYAADSAIKYTLLLPPDSSYNSPDQFFDAVEDIEIKRPVYLLFASTFYGTKIEDFTHFLHTRRPDLEHFLLNNYTKEPVGAGYYTVFRYTGPTYHSRLSLRSTPSSDPLAKISRPGFNAGSAPGLSNPWPVL